MALTGRGAAVFCGVLLGGFGVLGLSVSHNTLNESYYLIASWPFPIALFPAAALAAALDVLTPRTISSQTMALWPAYLGLVIYGVVAGGRWFEVSGRAAHENYAELFLIAVMAIHAAVFIITGGIFALFPKTRPAGFQIWLAYPVLLASWLFGGFLL
jgi:hypothetical protein